jgi:plastocyanin
LPSRVAVLAGVVLSMLVLGIWLTSASNVRAVASVTRKAGTRPATSPGRHRTHRRHRRARGHHREAARSGKRLIAASVHSAKDPRVTIADFSFSPASITVHVGDTVQWVNNGPSSHTATANDGSFNTGVLQKGQSASVVFHQPGTFPYHCSIHPFMHGTVVVLANAKTPSPTHPSHSSSPGVPANGVTQSSRGTSRVNRTAGAPAISGQGTLPFTGVNLVAIAVLGLVLSGTGLVLHWLHRRRLG